MWASIWAHNLKYSNYVIASFNCPFNAHVHTKYSEVSPRGLLYAYVIRQYSN